MEAGISVSWTGNEVTRGPEVNVLLDRDGASGWAHGHGLQVDAEAAQVQGGAEDVTQRSNEGAIVQTTANRRNCGSESCSGRIIPPPGRPARRRDGT